MSELQLVDHLLKLAVDFAGVSADAVVSGADGALGAAILDEHLHEVMRAEGEMDGGDLPARELRA